jgi:hypothetical protein
MSRAGLCSFVVTTAVLAPTLLLHAGRQQVGKLYAGDHGRMTAGKLKVDVTADHLIIDPGKKLHVQLTATAAEHARAKVSLLVYEQRGMGQYRVDLPPVLIDETEVTFDVEKAGASATHEVVFALPEHARGGDGVQGHWFFGHYTVLVVRPDEAAHLHALRRRASDQDISELGEAIDTLEHADASPDESAVARMDVFTRPTTSQVAIHAADRGTVDADIPVEVRVTNPTRRKLPEVSVSLETTPFGEVSDERHPYQGLAADLTTVTPSDGQTVALEPGETRTVVFHVTAKGAGTLGLFAHTECSGEHCYASGDDARIADGVVDAIDIEPKDAALARR